MAQQNHIGDTNKMVTAVEWLFEQIPFKWSSSRAAFEVLQQAKQMESKQIIETFKHAQVLHAINDETRGEQYYNQTYKT